MKINEKTFGVLPDGKEAKLYTLCAGDLEFSLTNFGAAWTSLIVPSRNGAKDDILLGFSDLSGFLNNKPYMGVTVGRFANRIKDASFAIDGKTFRLDANENGNSLHSGSSGFGRMLWKADAYEEKDGVYIRFELTSPDGEGGFPGNMKASVCYGLTKSNELTADYQAEVDQKCPVNLTNHAYFNLAGEGKGDILSHEVIFHSSSFIEIDDKLIPSGKIIQVKDDKAYDFTARRRIGAAFGKPDGYDQFFIVDGKPGVMRPCAEVIEPQSGRTMKISTTQPGVQFYTGIYLKDIQGKSAVYGKSAGFCLETQHFPDTPNHENFPSCIFGPGNSYSEKAVFSFSF